MDRVFSRRVVPVVVIDNVEDALPLAEALLRGGLDIAEITFRTAVASDTIQKISQAFPQMLVGAGTILDLEQLQRAKDAGAKFAVAPGLNRSIVKTANELGLPFIPGIMTPSDVESALELGCKLQKFFPAENGGGVKMLQALAGPYSHTGVKFIPLGGISPDNAVDYLRLPIVAAIGGTWIAGRKLIAEKKWDTIATNAAEALALCQQVRG